MTYPSQNMLKRNYADYYYQLEENTDGFFKKVKKHKIGREYKDSDLEFSVPSLQQGLVVESFESELNFSSSLLVSKNLNDYEIMIKNTYIGLNHVDWKSKKYRFNIYSFPWINGRESSGVVVKRGAKVDELNFPIGTEVFLASTSYRDLKTSTFQEYTVFDSRLVWKIPQQRLPNGELCRKFGLDFAAGIGVGLVTAGSAISTFFDFSGDIREGTEKLGNLIIWGGTSSVGIFAIQLARASKKFDKIIAISSQKHENYLKELGATCVIDRTQSEEFICGEIFKRCPQGVNYGIDVISKETATILSRILQKGEEGVKKLVCVVATPNISTSSIDVKSKSKLIIETVSIKKFHEDIEFGSEFVKFTSMLFEKSELKPLKALKIFKALEHFGEGIKNGLKELEEKGPSAEKYVVSI